MSSAPDKDADRPPVNATMPFPREEVERTVERRFEACAARFPDHPALSVRGRNIAYRELDAMANEVARRLRETEATPGCPVGLCIEDPARGVAAALGILKAGRFFVPLDPTLPAPRLTAMLTDAGCPLIVTDMPGELPSAVGEGYRLVDIWAPPAAVTGPRQPSADTAEPDSPAFILYTSGSTGAPRGVVQSHRSVLHNVMKYTNAFALSENDRISQLFSIGFGEAFNDLFCALLNGGCACLLNPARVDPAQLGQWVAREGLTVYHSVPTLFRAMVAGWPGALDFRALRYVNLSGETAYWSDWDLYRRCFPPTCRLVNSYGSTETKLMCQFFAGHDTAMEGTILPVGKAVADTEILLFDENGREAGPNQPAEIWVRSRYLSSGYWRQPDVTRERFLPDPATGSARLFRTGDRGLRDAASVITCLGRCDTQVKFHGYRVDLADIEAHLHLHREVAAAAVRHWEDGPEDPRLVAFVVPKAGCAYSPERLRSFLLSRLPGYMVPSLFVRKDTLPLNSNGKVDRLALPRPEPERTSTRHVPPRNEVEISLLGVWKRVLETDDLGVTDDFFALGGQSIKAMQCAAAIRDLFGVEMTIRAFFDHPTVEAMARLIQPQADRDGPSPAAHP